MRTDLLAGALALAALAAAPGDPARACAPALVRGPDAVVIEYDPFTLAPAAAAPLTAEFVNTAEAECRLELAVTDPAGEPVERVRLEEAGLDLRLVAQESGGLAPALTPGVFDLTLPPGGRTRAALDAVLSGEAVTEAGLYERPLRLVVRPRGGGEALLAPVPATVAVRARARAQINLAGAAAAFGGSSTERVDFGEAKTGAQARVFVQLRANTAATLTIASENGGTLRHATEKDAPPIPYDAVLDGRTLDLAAPTRLPVQAPRTIAGVSLPLDLTLGRAEGAMAGAHQDVLTFEFAPD